MKPIRERRIAIYFVALLMVCLLFIQCSIIKPVSARRIAKNLVDYKSITNYIISRNYHEDFNRTLMYDYGNLPGNDSLLYNFMRKENITSIHCIGRITGLTSKAQKEEFKIHNPAYRGDSLIEYHFFSIPVFSRRRQLIFDLSSDKEKERSKKDVLEAGIYYNAF
jgi:hypothetical protein